MVDLIVQRHGGDAPGDDISDPLIATDAVALVRGRNELDARALDKQLVDYELLPMAGLAPGKLLEIHEAGTGLVFRAKVKAVGLSKSLTRGRITVTLERPAVF